MSADALSDVLRTVRLTGAAFFDIVATAPWVAEQPPREKILPKILPGAGHLIAYHVVTEGRCFTNLIGEEPVEVEAGEVIVFTKGDQHVLSSSPGMRADPGALRWASSGLGTTGHLVLEQVQVDSGAVFTHIPYKGGGQQLNDALSGQFELLSTNLAPLQLKYIRSGQLKPLALGAPARLPSLPGTPTFAELGLEAANLTSLFGVFAPAGLRADIASRLNGEINLALSEPELQAVLLAADNLPAVFSSGEFQRQIELATEQNRRLLLAGRIKLE